MRPEAVEQAGWTRWRVPSGVLPKQAARGLLFRPLRPHHVAGSEGRVPAAVRHSLVAATNPPPPLPQPQFWRPKVTSVAQLRALIAMDSDIDEYEAKFTALVEADKAAAKQAKAAALPAGDGRSWNAGASCAACPPTDISPSRCCLHAGPGPG